MGRRRKRVSWLFFSYAAFQERILISSNNRAEDNTSYKNSKSSGIGHIGYAALFAAVYRT